MAGPLVLAPLIAAIKMLVPAVLKLSASVGIPVAATTATQAISSKVGDSGGGTAGSDTTSQRRNALAMAGMNALLKGTISASDSLRDMTKNLVHAQAQAGEFSGAILKSGEAATIYGTALGKASRATGQSMEKIAEASSSYLKTSFAMSSELAHQETGFKRVESAIKAYTDTIVVARSLGLDLNDVTSAQTELFKNQGLTVDRTNKMMMTLQQSVKGTTLTNKQALDYIQRMGQSYEFLSFDATKAALSVQELGQFHKENRDVFKSEQQLLKTYGNALEGVSRIQEDIGRSTFFGTMAGTGGKRGLGAGLEFEGLEGRDALESIKDTIGNILGGQGILTREQALSAGEGSDIQGMFVAQRKMIQDQLGMGQAEATKLMEYLSVMDKEGPDAITAQQKAEELLEEANKSDRHYQQRAMKADEQINMWLGSMNANLMVIANNVADTAYMPEIREGGAAGDIGKGLREFMEGISKGVANVSGDISSSAQKALLNNTALQKQKQEERIEKTQGGKRFNERLGMWVPTSPSSKESSTRKPSIDTKGIDSSPIEGLDQEHIEVLEDQARSDRATAKTATTMASTAKRQLDQIRRKTTTPTSREKVQGSQITEEEIQKRYATATKDYFSTKGRSGFGPSMALKGRGDTSEEFGQATPKRGLSSLGTRVGELSNMIAKGGITGAFDIDSDSLKKSPEMRQNKDFMNAISKISSTTPSSVSRSEIGGMVSPDLVEIDKQIADAKRAQQVLGSQRDYNKKVEMDKLQEKSVAQVQQSEQIERDSTIIINVDGEKLAQAVVKTKALRDGVRNVDGLIYSQNGIS